MEERRGLEEGEEKFREELLTQMSERLGAEHYGEERTEAGAALAVAHEFALQFGERFISPPSAREK